MLFFSF